MKQIKRLFNHSLCILLVCIFFTSCATSEVNRRKLGEKSHIMRDSKGDYWMVQHNIGDHYSLSFLGDSTLLEFK